MLGVDAAEFALAALLAIVFVYTLTISHSYNAPFSSSLKHRKHWWKARVDAPGWLEQHEQYVAEASAAVQRQHSQSTHSDPLDKPCETLWQCCVSSTPTHKVPGLVIARRQELQVSFYGDAIVEAWRGSQHGADCPSCQGAAEVFESHFGHVYNSHAWGFAGLIREHCLSVMTISSNACYDHRSPSTGGCPSKDICCCQCMTGDATQHLMWRLKHGEAPHSTAAQLNIILAGNSDLTYASFQDDDSINAAINSTSGKIHAMAEHLLSTQPHSQVLLVELLPRGDPTLPRGDPGLVPDQRLAQPSKFTNAVDQINTQLRQSCRASAAIHCLACGHLFLETGDSDRIHSSLMFDGLNLSQDGMQQLVSCLDFRIQEISKALM